MIGGEAAEAALARRRVPMDADQEPYDLGWVADWLYGDAALPPLPLPPREPTPRRAPPRPAAPARRKERQLALL